jgi:hypothetical protein
MKRLPQPHLVLLSLVVGLLLGCVKALGQETTGVPADVPVSPMPVSVSTATLDDLPPAASNPPEKQETPEPAPQGNAAPGGRDPFASDWLEAGYQVDSRHDLRVLSFEGHTRLGEHVDLLGQLDLESGLDQDASRFRLRAGVYGRLHAPVGVVGRVEDFNGSWNDHVRLGIYFDPTPGGEEPFTRVELLPVATQGGGMMARAMFGVAIRERWALTGFLEHAWGPDAGDFTAAEPELSYRVLEGLWATLEYRRDDRQAEPEGLALGFRAAL